MSITTISIRGLTMSKYSVLSERRKAAGLTQAELAERAGTLNTLIGKYEQGAAKAENMTLGVAARIAEALGCHAEDLLDKDEKEEEE